MLATTTLATGEVPVGTWLGSTAGMVAAVTFVVFGAIPILEELGSRSGG